MVGSHAARHPVSAHTATVDYFKAYSARLSRALADWNWAPAVALADELADCVSSGRQVFLAGNGGSAANAIHLANDFLYAWSKKKGQGLRVHALTENSAVISCLANDEGYENIFALQLAVQASRDDVLVVFSGSGNSANILAALKQARDMGLKSYAVLGYDGGAAKSLCDVPLHLPVDDMQIAEDFQLILGHMIMQHLSARRASLAQR